MKIAWSTATTPGLFRQSEEQLYALYHENSKLFPDTAREQAAQFGASQFELAVTSRGFRQYRHAATVPLPPTLPASETLQDVMLRRRSRRSLQHPVSLAELATVLQQALGPTDVYENVERAVFQVLRAWPSAGGLYPLETYIIAQDVAGLERGAYHHNVIANKLERLRSRDAAEIIRDGFFWQEFLMTASVAIIFAAVFERTLAKYGERGYRLVLLDAGHAAQNVLLVAEQLGLNAVAIAGFCDDSLAADLGLDSTTEAVVHAVFLGKSGA